jgi:hypothetical protein
MSKQSEAARLSLTLPSEVGCDGKVAFDTFRLADMVVHRHTKRTKGARTAYRCGHCHKWHVGTNKSHATAPQAPRDE